MNKKKILEITVLLAVIAICLTFAACPKPDEDERSVTFINRTASPITITFQNAPTINLKAQEKKTDPEGRATATKKGADLILNTITFELSTLNDGDIVIDEKSTVIAGKDSKKVDGISLAYGTIIFTPKLGDDTNPALPKKISTIQLND